MKEFNCLPKMKSDINCYKEGGSVYKSRHSETSESSQDVAQDKKIVKKAFSMHDKQSHEGAKTDLSKLRRGGRAKKEKGTVNMFKDGGMTKVKPTGDKKADAPSKAVVKGKEMPSFAEGGRPGAMSLESRQASGYSNLRDYLNSLSGKRRAGSTDAQHEAIQAAAAAKRGEAYSKPQPMNVGEGEKTSQADMSKYSFAEGGSMTPGDDAAGAGRIPAARLEQRLRQRDDLPQLAGRQQRHGRYLPRGARDPRQVDGKEAADAAPGHAPSGALNGATAPRRLCRRRRHPHGRHGTRAALRRHGRGGHGRHTPAGHDAGTRRDAAPAAGSYQPLPPRVLGCPSSLRHSSA